MNIIPKKELPETIPTDICIKFASKRFSTNEKDRINDISEAGIQSIINNIRNSTYKSLFLSLDSEGDIGIKFFQLESGEGWIFVQICDEEEELYYSSVNADYLNSNEEAPIICSDGQSVIMKRNTMHDLELAAECVKWFIRTGEPYPGMEWLANR
ncbi:MAG: hypothetical protein K2J04_12075 [Lachnospiraceae bacterium]|nr:hypothetical protein [Lachnospiraceae bacterium]